MSLPLADEDGFVYEELPIEDETLPELPPDLEGGGDGESDLHSMLAAMARASASSASASASSVSPSRTGGGVLGGGLRQGVGASSSSSSSVESLPGSADDFIRNFLIRARMHHALDAFNTEFYELKARRALPGEDILRVPDAYSANARLEEEVARMRVELAGAQELAGKAQATWDRFRRERDFHRMHHRRVVQEKNKLITDLRRLKAHYDKYEPTIAELRAKYELAMKDKANMRMERDRVSARCLAMEAVLKGAASEAPPSQAGAEGSSGSPTRAFPAGGSGAAAVAALAASAAASKARGGAAAPTSQSLARAGAGAAAASARPAASRPTGTAAAAAAALGEDGPSRSLLADARLPPDADIINPYYDMVFEPAHADAFRLTGTVRAHAAALSAVAFHPSKPVFASASDDNTWRLWAVTGAGGAELLMNGEGHKSWVSGVAFHPGGTALATCSGDGQLKLWSLTSAACTATLSEHIQPVWDCAWHFGGDFLLSASMDHTAKLWDAGTGKVRQSFRGHVDSVNACAWQTYSSHLATGSGDKTVSVWDARSGLCVQTFYGHTNAVNDVAFSLRGDSLVSCDSDGSVRLWDIRMVAERVSASVGRQGIHGCALDRSAAVVAVACDDGVVRTFDAGGSGVGGMGLLSSLRGHEDSAQCVAFDPNSQFLLSGSRDATVRIWSEGTVRGLDMGGGGGSEGRQGVGGGGSSA